MKKRKVELYDAGDLNMELKKMKKVSRIHGLNNSEIMEVVGKIESKKVALKEKHLWMQCLLPKHSIPREAFLRLSCLLSDSNFYQQIKLEIIKWMIVVYPYMKRHCSDMFRSLYELYFQLLNDKAMRPYICQFLYIITVKLDVTDRRINYLQEKLIAKNGRESFLILLLIKYYELSPSLFKAKPEAEFEVQFESRNSFVHLLKTIHPDYEPVYSTLEVSSKNVHVHRTVVSAASHVPKSPSKPKKRSLFLELFHEFEILKKSSATEILESKYRRLFLTTEDVSSYVAQMKLYDYIATGLKRNYFSSEDIQNIFKVFHEIQQSFRGIMNFILNPETPLDDSTLEFCVSLVQYELLDFSDNLVYKMDIIQEELLKSNNPATALNCFSRLYENWVLLHYNNYEASTSSEERSEESYTLQARTHIYKLSMYINAMCCKLLSGDIQPFLLNQILLLYERVSLSHMKVVGFVLDLPDYSVILAAMFSLSYFTLDNLGKVLLQYEMEVKHIESQKLPDASEVSKIFKSVMCDAKIFKIRHKCNDPMDTYLSRRNAVVKIKKHFPRLYKHLHLTKHPALILKRHEHDQNKTDTDDEYADYLDKNGLRYLIKLLENI